MVRFYNLRPHLENEVRQVWRELNNWVVLRVSWVFLIWYVLTSASTSPLRLVYEVSLQGAPPGPRFLSGSPAEASTFSDFEQQSI